MTGKIYKLNSGAFMLYIPSEIRKQAGLKDKDKVLFGVVKARKEFYFYKDKECKGRLSRVINRTTSGGTLVCVPKSIADVMELNHQDVCEFKYTRTAKRIYFNKK